MMAADPLDNNYLTRFKGLRYRNHRSGTFAPPCPLPELADLINEKSPLIVRMIMEGVGGSKDSGREYNEYHLLKYLHTMSESLRRGSFEPFRKYQLVQARQYAREGLPLEEVERRESYIFESLHEIMMKSARSPDQVLSFTLYSQVLEAFRDASSALVAKYYIHAREAELKDQETQLELLSQRLLTVQEEERKRIATDLHDELIQLLFGLRYELDIVRNKLGERSAVEDELSRMKGRIDQGLTELRRILRNLRPALLDDHGLVSALRLLVRLANESVGVSASLESSGEDDGLPTETKTCLYRVAQEALMNAVKHSHAGSVSLSLVITVGHVQLEIVDDGIGFDSSEYVEVSPGLNGEKLGLFGMNKRVRSMDGSLVIDSRLGVGTRVNAVLPLDEDHRGGE